MGDSNQGFLPEYDPNFPVRIRSMGGEKLMVKKSLDRLKLYTVYVHRIQECVNNKISFKTLSEG